MCATELQQSNRQGRVDWDCIIASCQLPLELRHVCGAQHHDYIISPTTTHLHTGALLARVKADTCKRVSVNVCVCVGDPKTLLPCQLSVSVIK